jgi:heme exporter protein D
MILDILILDGYGKFVWSAYIFTILSFTYLYFLIKSQFEKERKKFVKKFGLLDAKKIKLAYRQKIYTEILVTK